MKYFFSVSGVLFLCFCFYYKSFDVFYCKFYNNVIVEQKEYIKASKIRNKNDLKRVVYLKIVDADRANSGDYILKSKDFYYILNKNDIWQYDIIEIKDDLTQENGFDLNVKIKRKAVLMYYVDNAVIAKYITQRCNNVWNYENVKKGDFLSFNNKDYINAIDCKYVFFKYNVIKLNKIYFYFITIIESLLSLVFDFALGMDLF
jgi:hypothetical protein